MLYLKAFHLLAVIAWFAGLFYLPRLFVYHADARDSISVERFKVMERRLYYGITWPAGVMTTFLGVALLHYNLHYYLHTTWMQIKLLLIILVWVYHLVCGHFLYQFAKDRNKHTARFFRFFNEVPTLLLLLIVLLVVVKP